MRALMDYLHRLASRFFYLVKASALLRNQLNCVTAYYLGETNDSEKNGEYQLVDQLAPHCSTFVDVGANVGNWSEYFLRKKAASGFLFEPSEKCVAVLKTKFEGAPVVLSNVAVGDKSGLISFFEEENCGEGSSVAAMHENSGGVVKQVPIVTIDEEFLGKKILIDYLKIDTEGYDLNVLKGAETCLRSGRIRFIQFEYNLHWLGAGASLKVAKSFLEKDLGFRLLLIRSTGLHPLNYGFWGDYFRYSNFFAYRPVDEHLIRPLIGKPF